jgi:hypothetical protein
LFFFLSFFHHQKLHREGTGKKRERKKERVKERKKE